jgi:hypothetical protein
VSTISLLLFDVTILISSTPVPLVYEKFYQPDVIRVFDKLVETLSY